MRLIDADVLYETLCHVWDRSDSEEFEQAVFKVIANAPTADRPTGEWIMHIDDLYPEESTQECSNCHEHETIYIRHDSYCPNCGARMYKGGEDE